MKKRVQTGPTKNTACVIQTISKAENGFCFITIVKDSSG